MYIIAGDSWGCGEWDTVGNSHPGLVQYMRDAEFETVNLSLGGGSNWQTYRRLQSFLEFGVCQYLTCPVNRIFIFQTEWFRDINIQMPEILQILNSMQEKRSSNYVLSQYSVELSGIVISNWYHRLTELSQKYHIPISLLGGSGEPMWIDNFEQEYPGVSIACQSITNLCINHQHRVDVPITGFAWSTDLVEKCKKVAVDTAALEFLMQEIKRGEIQMARWKSSTKWFGPDHRHANRHAHYRLFKFLQDLKLIV